MSGTAPTLGERLKAAREARGFSAQKVADQLHLDGWVIEALESGDYAKIGPAVYGKGHLKRYAGILGLSVADVIEAYDRGSGIVPPVLATAPSEPTEEPLMVPLSAGPPAARTWVITGLAALLVAGVFWWRPWQPRDAAPGAGAASPPAPQNVPQYAGGERADGSAGAELPAEPGAQSQPPVRVAGPAGSAAGSAQGQDSATAGVGRARLRLSFSAPSWVDVRDADGRRLYAGNGQANSVRTVAGDAPMKVYLGFASGVQLQVNNRVVAIGPQFIAGDVARFEAGADGVLRRDAHPVTSSSPRPRG